MDLICHENSADQGTKLKDMARKMVEMGVILRLIRVFNPQVTTIDGKIFKVQVSKKGLHVVIDSNGEAIEVQMMPRVEWQVTSGVIREEQS